MPLPRLVDQARLRPIDLAVGPELSAAGAPFVAVTTPAAEEVSLTLASGADRLTARVDDRHCWLEVTTADRTSRHRSRRHGRRSPELERVTLTLSGSRASLVCEEAGTPVVRAVVDLSDRLDVHDETWLAGLWAEGGALRSFGQLGLRDLRAVTLPDGTPYPDERGVLLTATSAGPGFFDTAHTSVWVLDPDAPSLTHLSDLFFRRPDRPGVYGDHACHLLRDGDRWLVAASTWGDFRADRPGARVDCTLAETTADVLTGRHVLDTRPLHLPTTGLVSVGVWDPHLVRTDDGWLVAYVSARKFFAFHPVLAAGPDLDRLALRAAVPDLDQTEGSTLVGTDEGWRLLASDGEARRYPVYDLDLVEVGELSAPYPSNIPWPTLVRYGDTLLQVAFDGEPAGGRLPGYGTHGAVRLARSD